MLLVFAGGALGGFVGGGSTVVNGRIFRSERSGAGGSRVCARDIHRRSQGAAALSEGYRRMAKSSDDDLALQRPAVVCERRLRAREGSRRGRARGTRNGQ